VINVFPIKQLKFKVLHNNRYNVNPRNVNVELPLKIRQRKVIDAFYKQAQSVKKCENCGALSPQYRKDGTIKIFEKAHRQEMKKTMAMLHLQPKVTVILHSIHLWNHVLSVFALVLRPILFHHGSVINSIV
jgi:hypothetical protein